ncbi:MAG: DUF1289 domain-containing protein [Methylomonas sp.]|nr:DUF1289 domain-containing protein [Methylomonas sp.]PPD21982.1 MAG: DUF1289 domain-containing protein [Methylomonas sp.]PPD25559.1 MAG: DUF1289 domain-containing protein [Methylomonas sp.]PPD36469.1 MAG: DUF1289 domain-containing protein [Methylomonas sp.]PPD39508.1 MAG: DUF1289 domain-containing protein [Methylomonas sp.]
MLPESQRVPSPCVRNCCLNDGDICLGCFRSMQEICQWLQASDELRVQFLENARQRRKALTLPLNAL